jgi:hypothetical protein
MLYAFHADRNRKNPGSIHATYMLTGYRAEKNKEEEADEDTAMDSSPFDASEEPRLVRTVVVVPEEKLEGMHSCSPP